MKKITPKYGSTVKNLILTFLPQFFLGVSIYVEGPTFHRGTSKVTVTVTITVTVTVTRVPRTFQEWAKIRKIIFFYYFPKSKFSGKDIYQNIGSGEVIFNFFGSVVIFFVFFTIFWKIKSDFLKKLHKNGPAYRAKFSYRIRFFGNFPHILDMLTCVENCETFKKLDLVVCGSGPVISFLRPGFWQYCIFTK